MQDRLPDILAVITEKFFMTPDEVIATLDKLIYLLGTYDITTIRASMGMYLIW